MDFIYVVFFVVGKGWAFMPGFYPLQVENCEDKVDEMLPRIEEIYKADDKTTDFELGCLKADSYKHLRDLLKKRYPPGQPS